MLSVNISIPFRVGAENDVTAADLAFAVVRRVMKLGIWLRKYTRLGHCRYSCHCDSPTAACTYQLRGITLRVVDGIWAWLDSVAVDC